MVKYWFFRVNNASIEVILKSGRQWETVKLKGGGYGSGSGGSGDDTPGTRSKSIVGI